MNVWRIHLKPDPMSGISFENVLKFCIDEQIIGVGWALITCTTDDRDTLHAAVYNSTCENKSSAFKGINAMRQIQPGDLIWTRLGQDASEYYLCQVGDQIWKNRVITQKHINHDICQFVSAKWVYIGKENRVPGKVINSFIPRASVQRVRAVEELSKFIWNKHCADASTHYTDLREMSFWDAIGSEDLECMVLLYLQYLGNYIYSTTLKKGTAKIEAVMVSKDGKTRLYPQVKRSQSLRPADYTDWLNPNERAVLFTTSEDYGSEQFPNVDCLTKAELEAFMRDQIVLLPDNVKYWLELTNFK